MKKFEITYADQSGKTFQTSIIERDEAAAKKSFKANNKGAQIEAIQLTAENVNASKAQEREALEEIRKIVEAMGPDSYIATAFDGCFEIAEENIEFDFADSMKGRLEMTEKAQKKTAEQVVELQTKLDLSLKTIDRLRAELDEAEARTISGDDLVDIIQLITDRRNEHEEAMKKAAAEIIDHADAPTSKEFQEAVRIHRSHKNAAEYCQRLLDRMQRMKDAGEQ